MAEVPTPNALSTFVFGIWVRVGVAIVEDSEGSGHKFSIHKRHTSSTVAR